ncbi:MAG: TetR/AcrR family transcriptional regulator [Prevotellaceae bacterium]|nr:TetR/AcrR family transcriptional regulator [Prevotellaceae bacterium]
MNIREQITKTATGLFFRHGLRRISVDDVCKELRISKKTFYACFKQKEELVASVLKEQGKRQKKFNIDTDCNVIDVWLKNSQLIKTTGKYQPAVFFSDLMKYYPDMYQKHCELTHSKIQRAVRDGIELGIAQGMFRADIDLEMMSYLLSLFNTSFFAVMYKDHSRVLDKLIDFMIDTQIRIIASEQGLAYYYKQKREELLTGNL